MDAVHRNTNAISGTVVMRNNTTPPFNLLPHHPNVATAKITDAMMMNTENLSPGMGIFIRQTPAP
tara:strand:- start:10008 stop:10202 length:195 start_codon:yes stop_codon:yes gene_type:complete